MARPFDWAQGRLRRAGGCSFNQFTPPAPSGQPPPGGGWFELALPSYFLKDHYRVPPFSWIYNGNANGDTRNDNDLIYVPARADEIILTSNNWDALDAFIASEDDLDDARGSIITRNSARSPWRNILDLNLTQQIHTVSNQRVELTAHVLNVLNLLGTGAHKLGLTDGRDWGEIQYPNFNNYRLLDFEGYVGDDDIGTTIAGREITDDDLGKPIVSFDEVEDRDDLFLRSNLASRWQMQFGIRYVF